MLQIPLAAAFTLLADSGAGYCVFNDPALAANRLIEEGDVRAF
jgi:acetoin utilization deacetylase AcuC-like enzyme